MLKGEIKKNQLEKGHKEPPESTLVNWSNLWPRLRDCDNFIECKPKQIINSNSQLT